ncbi:MAG: peroxiredoxin [Candidatus Pacearchaeota archaeon]|nr:peroxiredoxin [Candidatus Pacearchaeota archaeon]
MKSKNFKLKDKFGKPHELNDFKEKYKVIYFYPKDNTPGCTIEANQFSELLKDFKKLSTKIIGISGGDEKSKTKFCEKYNLKVLLLSDPDFKVSKDFKVYGEKSFMGRKFLGINRRTFILDKNNNILKVYEKVNALGHAKEVLDFIKELK